MHIAGYWMWIVKLQSVFYQCEILCLYLFVSQTVGKYCARSMNLVPWLHVNLWFRCWISFYIFGKIDTIDIVYFINLKRSRSLSARLMIDEFDLVWWDYHHQKLVKGCIIYPLAVLNWLVVCPVILSWTMIHGML